MAYGFTRASTDALVTSWGNGESGSAKWSMSAWVYYLDSSTLSSLRVFSMNSTTDGPFEVFVTESADRLQSFAFWSTTNANHYYNNIPTNQWIHLCVTYDGSAAAGTDPLFYIDGSSVSVVTSTNSAGSIGSAPNNAQIGNLNGADRAWDGYIASVELYKGRILSAAEVDSLAKGFLASDVQQDSLTLDVQMVRAAREMRGTGSLTENGSLTVEPHPRTHPRRRPVYHQ